MNTSIDVSYWGFLFSIWFISTLLVKFFITKYVKPKVTKTIHHPPSPPRIPLIGHLHLLSTLLHKSFQTLASRYGPLMKISMGASSLVVVSDANVAREVLKVHDLNFVNRPKFGGAEYNMYSDAGFFVAEYGPYWRFIKKTCMTKILSPPQLSRSTGIRQQELMTLLNGLVKCSERGVACDLGFELMTMTNNIVCRMTMSTRCSGTSNEATKIREFTRGIMVLGNKLALGEVLGPFLQKFDLLGYGKSLKVLLSEFDDLMEGIMREHEKERGDGDLESKDMMDFLLEIYGDEASEVKLTRTNIKAFFLVSPLSLSLFYW